jgi:hypothetical protein
VQLICRHRCVLEIAADRAGISRKRAEITSTTRSIKLRTLLIAMRKLRISNHPARSASSATMRAIAG